MIGPAARGRLIHNQPFEFKRSHRTVAHGIGQRLGFILHPRESEIILPVSFKGKRTFHKTFGQIFNLYRLRSQFCHVALQARNIHSSSRPINISLTIFINQHARVYAIYAFNRFSQWGKRTGRFIGNGYANFEPSLIFSFRRRWKIEIIFSVGKDTVGSPHGI